jgi:UDP-N-acetylmuramoylalanine--D-glutamate ligase
MSHGLETDRPITREELLSFVDAPVHVIGAASAEGIAVLRLLLALGFTDITVHDMRERDVLRKAFNTVHGAYSRGEQNEIWKSLKPTLDAGAYGADYLAGIDGAAVVSLGQGWYLDADNRRRVVERVPPTARVISMSALYFALHRGPIAGITGTNGKSTTTALAEHLLEQAGVPFLASGNERSSQQFLPRIDEIAPGTWALLEVSNRQLMQIGGASPNVAAITALTPDHLEEHGGWDGYRDTKARLFTWQQGDDVAIVNADDVEALAVAERSPVAARGRLVRCGIGEQLRSPSVAWIDGQLIARDVPRADGSELTGDTVLAQAADLRMPGAHNQRNAAVAAALAIACGADPSGIADALRTFEGKALRLQRLDTIDGVDVWSDLKSTTPEATIAALSALADRRVVLIAGGSDKGLDYAPLAAAVAAGDVHALAVPGSATDALEAALHERADGSADRFERVADLAEALDRGFDVAASGDVVIVSPAAAGFWTQELQGASSLRSLIQRRAQKL